MKACNNAGRIKELGMYLWVSVYLAGLIAGSVAEAPATDNHNQLIREARATLSRATRHFRDEIACHGGYLWRYKEDLSDREGEAPATAS